MSFTDTWVRVSRAKPCPLCQRTKYCAVGRAGTEYEGGVLCTVKVSRAPFAAAGYFHRLYTRRPVGTFMTRLAAVVRPPPSEILTDLAAQAEVAMSPQSRRQLAERLCLSIGSLRRLAVGEVSSAIAAEHGIDWALGAWTFPMRNAAGAVVGARLRLRNGDKRAVKGGREGLFIPRQIVGARPLLVCEGPTDTAAMLDLGFEAVGIPSAGGGSAELLEFVKRLGVADVVVVADADAAGRKSAATLAAILVAHVHCVRVIEPPEGLKDARDWRRWGASRADVEARIAQAPLRSLRSTNGGAA